MSGAGVRGLLAVALLGWAGPAAEERLVVLGGAVAEGVIALGAQGALVGLDDSAALLPQAPKLPTVGYYRSFSVEGVLALKPSRVLALETAGPQAAWAQLAAAGVAVERLPAAASLEAGLARVRRLGVILGREAAAEALAGQMEAAARPTGREGPRALVLFVHGGKRLQLAGADTAAHAMVVLAGGRPALGQVRGYTRLNPEALLLARPEILVLTPRSLAAAGGEERLWALPGIAATPAGKARRHVVVPDHALLGFGPGMVAGLAALRAAFQTEAR